MKRFALSFVTILILTGCVTVNPYSQYYFDNTRGKHAAYLAKKRAPMSQPIIHRGTNPKRDAHEMAQNSYHLLGYSSFNGGRVNQNQAITHARNIRANAVIMYSTYTHTLSGTMPLTSPDVKTVTTHGSGHAFGSGTAFGTGGSATYSGSASAFGSSRSTIYGSKTTYIPYNVRRYEYHASFWRKIPNIIFGAVTRDLSAEERKAIGSNSGIVMKVVMKNSPAFTADLFEDDIITTVNGDRIQDAKAWHKQIGKYAGQTITLEIIRDGAVITKEVTLNKKPERSSNKAIDSD